MIWCLVFGVWGPGFGYAVDGLAGGKLHQKRDRNVAPHILQGGQISPEIGSFGLKGVVMREPLLTIYT